MTAPSPYHPGTQPGRHDEGQVLGLVIIVLALAAAATLAFAVGSLSTQRSVRAQTGADAAALGAIEAMRTDYLRSLTQTPFSENPTAGASTDCSASAWTAANNYARANGTVLDRCTVDQGVARVSVHTVAGTSTNIEEVSRKWGDQTSPAKTAEASATFRIAWDLRQRPSSSTSDAKTVKTAGDLRELAEANGLILDRDSGLLGLEPSCERPIGVLLHPLVSLSLMHAEADAGQPMAVSIGWADGALAPTECEGVSPVRQLSDHHPSQTNVLQTLRVAQPEALLRVVGSHVALCRPFPDYPHHFAASSQPVCGGRRGPLASGFPNLDQLLRTEGVLTQ